MTSEAITFRPKDRVRAKSTDPCKPLRRGEVDHVDSSGMVCVNTDNAGSWFYLPNDIEMQVGKIPRVGDMVIVRLKHGPYAGKTGTVEDVIHGTCCVVFDDKLLGEDRISQDYLDVIERTKCTTNQADEKISAATISWYQQASGRTSRPTPFTIDQRLIAIGKKHESVIPQIETMRKMVREFDELLAAGNSNQQQTKDFKSLVAKLVGDVENEAVLNDVPVDLTLLCTKLRLQAVETAIAIRIDNSKPVVIRQPARIEPLEVMFDVNGDDDP